MEIAEKIKSEINDFVQNEVLSIVESYLTEVSSEFDETIIQLDKVSLSIDTSSWNVHSDKMKVEIRDEVKRKIDPIVKQVKENTVLNEKNDLNDREKRIDHEAQVYGKKERILKSLFHFLDHGILPWWISSLEESREIFSEKTLTITILDNLSYIARELEKRDGNQAFVQRLIKQLPFSVVTNLIAIKLSHTRGNELKSSNIKKVTSVIQTIDQLPKDVSKKILALILQLIEEKSETVFHQDAAGMLFKHVHTNFFRSNLANAELDLAFKTTHSIVKFLYLTSGKEEDHVKIKRAFLLSVNKQVSENVWKHIQTTTAFKEQTSEMSEEFKKSVLNAHQDIPRTTKDSSNSALQTNISDAHENKTSSSQGVSFDNQPEGNSKKTKENQKDSSQVIDGKSGLKKKDAHQQNEHESSEENSTVQDKTVNPSKKFESKDETTSSNNSDSNIVDYRTNRKNENTINDIGNEATRLNKKDDSIKKESSSLEGESEDENESVRENETSERLNKTSSKENDIVDYRSKTKNNKQDSKPENQVSDPIDANSLPQNDQKFENEISDSINEDAPDIIDYESKSKNGKNDPKSKDEISDSINEDSTTQNDQNIVDYRSKNTNDQCDPKSENETSDPISNTSLTENDTSDGRSKKEDERNTEDQNGKIDVKNKFKTNELSPEQAKESTSRPLPNSKPETTESKNNALQINSEEDKRSEHREKLNQTLKESLENTTTPRKKNNVPLPDAMYVNNAGLVLLNAFLPAMFKQLNLLSEDGQLLDPELAACILHFAATGREGDFEFEMAFEKYLCGLSPEESIEREIALSETHKEEVDKVLNSALLYWKAMKNKSTALFQNEFLMREGKLIIEKSNHRLIVEKKAFDPLLNKLPWNYSMVKFSWKKELIFVEW